MMPQKFRQAVLYMLASSSFISLLGLSAKTGLQEISFLKLTFYRYFGPLLISLPFLWFDGTFKNLWPPKNIKNHILRSVSAVTAQLSMIYYLTESNLLDATMLWCTGPLFLPLIVHFLYKQKVQAATWISIAVSFAGVALVIKPDRGIFDPFSLFGLLSGVAMGFSQVFWGLNTEEGKVGENLFYLFFLGSLWLTIPIFIFDPTEFKMPIDKTVLYAIIGLTIASLCNQFFRSLAYKSARPYLLAPFIYFSVFLSGMIDWLYYKHPPDWIEAMGFCLVALGAYIKWNWIRRHTT